MRATIAILSTLLLAGLLFATPLAASDFIRGDVTADGSHALNDAIVLLGYLFAGGIEPVCLEAADFNDDGDLGLADPIGILAYLFTSGNPPSAPFPDCGPDPTPDALGCVGPVPACPVNQAPTITSSAPLTAVEGELYSYDVEATDPDVGDVLTYSLPTSPAGATIDPVTGIILWTPDGTQTGAQNFVVRATDSGGLFDEQAFVVDVTAVNDAPTITSTPPTTATEGELYTYDVEATDPDVGDVLTYSLPTSPAGATIDPVTGVILWTPDGTQSGTQDFVVRVTDSGGLFDEQAFTVDVTGVVNAPPVITSIAPIYALADGFYQYPVVAEDPNPLDTLVFSLELGHPDAFLDPSGYLYWSPQVADLGDHGFVVRVTDDGGLFDEQAFTVAVVSGGDTPPQIVSSPPLIAVEDRSYSYWVQVNEVDPGDTLTFTLEQGPPSAFLDPFGGYLDWYPTAGDIGFHDFTVRVTDSTGLFDEQSFTVEVQQNLPPVITSTPPTDPVPSGGTFTYEIVATDPNPDTYLFFELVSGPADAYLESWGLLTWTTNASHVGQNAFVIRVYDDAFLFDEQSFTVEVLPPNGEPPVITSTPSLLAFTDTLYTYAVTATDPDPGDTQTFSLLMGSFNAYLEPMSGVLTWYPQSYEAGPNDFVIRVTDSEGLFDEQAFTVMVEVALAPQITSTPVTSATEAEPYLYDVDATDGNPTDVLTYTLETAPMGATIDPAFGLIGWTPGPQQTGPHDFLVRVTDLGGLYDEQFFTVDVTDVEQPPVITSLPPTTAATGVPFFYGVEYEDPDSASVTFSLTAAPVGATIDPSLGDLVWIPDVSQVGLAGFTVRATDAGGAFGEQSFTVSVQDGSVPLPDPALVAPPLDGTESTVLANAVAFLYQEPEPFQVGVTPGTIDVERIAVLRGRVIDRDGNPLEQVQVSRNERPEFGVTRTRADGSYDLVVNGGGFVALRFEKDGYLSAQRKVVVPWQDYIGVEDVALIELDPIATVVDFSEPMQVAQGSVQTDVDGTRQTTMLFPGGTTATMVLPDGSTQPLSSIVVRATEYTVGENGPAAMPGDLPGTVAYTYCVELSVDEALAAGARTVEFSQPVYHYLENFLDFPIGTGIPVGWFDPERSAWVPSDNGLIIAILSVSGGLADIDVDDSGIPADPATLADLGFTDAEREQLASLYAVGQSLWRVPIDHFTSWDCNWPYTPPDGAIAPGQGGSGLGTSEGPARKRPREDDDCAGQGSIIDIHNQRLGESIAVPGTDFSLWYSSDRVVGRTANRTIRIEVTPAEVPSFLEGVAVSIDVAGQVHVYQFSPLPDQELTFVWDGLDVYGREVQGAQLAKVNIVYGYPAVYREPGPFVRYWAQFPPDLTAGPLGETRGPAQIRRTFATTLVHRDERDRGLGGWSLDVHHAYDPTSRTLLKGDGEQRRADAVGRVIEPFAGNGTADVSAEGDSALEHGFHTGPMAVGPTGNVYVTNGVPDRVNVVEIQRDGRFRTVAGNGLPGYEGDGGPATEAPIAFVYDVAVDDDGNLYFSQWMQTGPSIGIGGVRKVDTEGVITTVLGGVPAPNPLGQSYPDAGDPAVGSPFAAPRALTVDKEKNIYLTGGGGGVTKVTADGLVDYPDLTETPYVNIRDLAVDPSDNLYILFGAPIGTSATIYRLRVTGEVELYAGGAPLGSDGEGMPATEVYLDMAMRLEVDDQGRVYYLEGASFHPPDEEYQYFRIRRIDADGRVRTLVGRGRTDVVIPPGGGFPAVEGIGGLARDVFLPFSSSSLYEGFALGPQGNMYIGHSLTRRIHRVALTMGAYSGAGRFVASRNGRELYHFSHTGRHLATFDATTGVAKHSFEYDTEGRLSEITDRNGRVTTIARDGSGDPTAVIAPSGLQTDLVLDIDGYVSAVTLPGPRTYSIGYAGDGGLLDAFTRPSGNGSVYAYDADGVLISAQNDAGLIQTLAHQEIIGGHEVTHTTGAGRTTLFRVEHDFDSGHVRTRIDPTGNSTVAVQHPAGLRTLTYADGTVTTLKEIPDPRFGMQSPLIGELDTTTPTGIVTTLTHTRDVLLSDPNDLLSVVEIVDTFDLGGNTYVHTVDVPGGFATSTSPEGRQLTRFFDALGRTTGQASDPFLDPLSATYDGLGRIVELGTPGQFASYTYDALDRVVTKLVGGTLPVDYTYDTAGNIVTSMLPSGRSYQYAYDLDGNRTSVTMPGSQVHALGYDAAGRLVSYSAPGNAPASRAYSPDGDLSSITLSTGRTQLFGYDAAGQLTMLDTAEANVGFVYDTGAGCCGALNRLGSLTRTPLVGLPETIDFAYDGSLLTSTTFTGAASGFFDYSYDDQLELIGIARDGGPALALGRDADGFLTSIGPFTITNGGPDGTVSAIDDGVLLVQTFTDATGRFAGRSHSVVGVVVYDLQISYDGFGRVATRVETVDGVTQAYDYAYDFDSQLLSVHKDGLEVESYAYDLNGNRISAALDGGAADTASYDAQDRLVQLGTVPYVFDDDGFLVARGGDSFLYGTTGELLQVTLSGGDVVEYDYDGLRRRVARSDAAGTTQYLYGNPSQPFQLSASRDPLGTVTDYTYDEAGMLFSFERGGAVYYVATDQLGTPRVVVDGGGAVVKTSTHTSYGDPIEDTDPAFELAIGYAGGLADAASGLVHLGLRDYDPAAGRWTSRDPLLYEGGQGNLYAYAGNTPVNRLDRTGLFSFGFSAFAGIGGGVKVAFEPGKGFSVCFEVGFGVGGGTEVDLDGAIDPNTDYVQAEVSAEWGPVSASASAKLDDCGNFTAEPKAKVGAVEFTPEGAKINPSDAPKSMKDAAKNMLEGKKEIKGKVSGTSCRQVKF